MIKKIYAIIKYFIGYLKDLQIIIKISPKFVFSFFALILFYTAYSQTNDWKNPSVLAIHKEDYHISVVPFPDEQKAFDLEKEKSPYYLSLNGSWKYKFIPDVSFLPVNYKPEFDVNSWDTVQVPGIISQSSSNLKAAGNSSSVNSTQ
ncbi:MAG: hypothetical protein Q8905_05560, partial [Bacteroidota bacterium]|nr:hypothetical protein [Bacteroidota bacterium]